MLEPAKLHFCSALWPNLVTGLFCGLTYSLECSSGTFAGSCPPAHLSLLLFMSQVLPLSFLPPCLPTFSKAFLNHRDLFSVSWEILNPKELQHLSAKLAVFPSLKKKKNYCKNYFMPSLARLFVDKQFESSWIHFINLYCKSVFNSNANNSPWNCPCFRPGLCFKTRRGQLKLISLVHRSLKRLALSGHDHKGTKARGLPWPLKLGLYVVVNMSKL